MQNSEPCYRCSSSKDLSLSLHFEKYDEILSHSSGEGVDEFVEIGKTSKAFDPSPELSQQFEDWAEQKCKLFTFCRTCGPQLRVTMDQLVNAHRLEEERCTTFLASLPPLQQQDLTSEIKNLQTTKQDNEAFLKALTKRPSQTQNQELIQKQEEEFWKKVNTMEKELQEFRSQKKKFERQKTTSEEHTSKITLKQQLKDAYIIKVTSGIASINGLHIGSLPTMQIQQTEIDAGLGEIAMLLHFVNSCLPLRSKNFAIFPEGSCSTIRKHEKSYNLFRCQGQQSLISSFIFNPWSYDSFDDGMMCLVEYIQEFEMRINKSRPFTFPHRMGNDTIGDEYLIVKKTSDEQQWTKAMRLLLENLDFLINNYC